MLASMWELCKYPSGRLLLLGQLGIYRFYCICILVWSVHGGLTKLVQSFFRGLTMTFKGKVLLYDILWDCLWQISWTHTAHELHLLQTMHKPVTNPAWCIFGSTGIENWIRSLESPYLLPSRSYFILLCLCFLRMWNSDRLWWRRMIYENYSVGPGCTYIVEGLPSMPTDLSSIPSTGNEQNAKARS